MSALPHAGPASRPLAGIASIVAAMAVLSASDALAKWLSASYPVLEIVFLRNLFAFLPLAAVAVLWNGGAALRTRRFSGHMLRAVAAFGAMVTFFAAVSLMPLADATAVGFAAPLLITALSVPILKERVGTRRWAAIIVGLLGVLLIARPGASVFQPGALLALAGAFCYALTAVVGRLLSRTEATATILFYTMAFGLLASAVPIPLVWVTPEGADWALFGLLGLLGAGGHVFLVTAFRHAEAAIVAPFEYSVMIWATGFGYVLFGELPDAWTLAGATVVVMSGLYILQRETRLTARFRRSPVDRHTRPGDSPRTSSAGGRE